MSPTGKHFATNYRDSNRAVAAPNLAIWPSSLPGDFDRATIPKGIIAPRERTSRSWLRGVPKLPVIQRVTSKSRFLGFAPIRILLASDAPESDRSRLWSRRPDFALATTVSPTGLSRGAAIVGIASTQLPSLDRVEAFEPELSYLMHKLQNTQLSVGGTGSRMPSVGLPFDEVTLATVRSWIRAGAQR